MIRLVFFAHSIFRSHVGPPRCAGRPLCAGYSLFDTMITLTIVGVLASFAPSLNNLVQEERLTTTVNGLVTDLALTRSEALRRGVPATLCKSRDGAQCDTRAAWHEGWIIFVDTDGDRRVDDGEVVVRVQQHLEERLSLRFAGFASNHAVSYQPNGMAENNGTFTLCDSRGAGRARAVILNYVGRAYTSRKSASGEVLVCAS